MQTFSDFEYKRPDLGAARRTLSVLTRSVKKAKSADEVVQAINAAFNRAAGQEAVQRRLTDLTMTVRADTTPASANQWLTAEIAKWGTIIREAGITIN